MELIGADWQGGSVGAVFMYGQGSTHTTGGGRAWNYWSKEKARRTAAIPSKGSAMQLHHAPHWSGHSGSFSIGASSRSSSTTSQALPMTPPIQKPSRPASPAVAHAESNAMSRTRLPCCGAALPNRELIEQRACSNHRQARREPVQQGALVPPASLRAHVQKEDEYRNLCARTAATPTLMRRYIIRYLV